jgi:hypothetical protein
MVRTVDRDNTLRKLTNMMADALAVLDYPSASSAMIAMPILEPQVANGCVQPLMGWKPSQQWDP